MANRMAVAMLALIGVMISLYMSAYKLGFIGSLMCGSGGCNTVQNSPWAVFAGIPVPFIGLMGYFLMFMTAIIGVQPRYDESRVIPIVLLVGGTIGLLFSAYLTYLEASVIHAWCRWCVGSATLAVVIFLAVLPELKRLRPVPQI